MCGELEKDWEVIVAYCKVSHHICLERLGKTTKENAVMVAGVQPKTQTVCFLNKSYSLSVKLINLLSFSGRGA
jgi:hypothetical protein